MYCILKFAGRKQPPGPVVGHRLAPVASLSKGAGAAMADGNAQCSNQRFQTSPLLSPQQIQPSKPAPSPHQPGLRHSTTFFPILLLSLQFPCSCEFDVSLQFHGVLRDVVVVGRRCGWQRRCWRSPQSASASQCAALFPPRLHDLRRGASAPCALDHPHRFGRPPGGVHVPACVIRVTVPCAGLLGVHLECIRRL